MVQLCRGGEGSSDLIEATNTYNDDFVEPLAVPPGLAGLGFGDQDGPYPSRDLDITNDIVAPALVDSAFLALGAAEDFSVMQYHTDTGARAWSEGDEIIPYVPLKPVSDDPETQAMIDDLYALEQQELHESLEPEKVTLKDMWQVMSKRGRRGFVFYSALTIGGLIAAVLIFIFAP